MVRFSRDSKFASGLEDGGFLLRPGRPWAGIPVGDFVEAKPGAGGGEEYLEVEGARRWRQEGFGLVSMMARQSKLGIGAVGGVWMANSGGRSDEDDVGGEPGGEAEARGRRGCQGEPLRGLTRWRGMVRPGGWEWSAGPRVRTRSDRGGESTMSGPAEPDPSCRARTQTTRVIALCEKEVEGARVNAPPIVVNSI
jgi:hypothetical protein